MWFRKMWLLLCLMPLLGIAETLDSAHHILDTSTNVGLIDSTSDTTSSNSTTFANQTELPLPRINSNKWWIFLFAIFVMIAIGILNNINPGRHLSAFTSYWVNPKTENEIVEDGFGVDAFLISEVGLSFLILGWLVMQFNPFDLNFTIFSEFTLFLLCILGVALIYVFKLFIHYIVGLVLQADRLSKLMVYSQANMLYSLCLFLFPCLLVLYYTQNEFIRKMMAIVIVVFLVVHVLLRWLKSFRIYFEFFPYSMLYIFIYLCALEILPLLVLAQLILFRA